MNRNSLILRNIQLMILGLLLSTLQIAVAQSDGDYGTTMNISYGAGARAMGLGRAYVSIANDPTAVFWNPAGLELVPRASFSLFHNQLFEGTIYDFAGFVYPTLTYGTFGFGFARLGTGDIILRDAFNRMLPGTLSYEEDEIYVSYGKKLPLNLYGGGTFKIRRQAFNGGEVNAEDTGFGFDLGLMYRPGWDEGIFSNMGFGFSYRNLLSPSLNVASQAEQEPYHLTFGMVKGIRAGESGIFNIVLDMHKSRYEALTFLAGTEYVFRDLGTIRVGMDNLNPTFGAGVKYSFLQIDYSFGTTISNGEFPPTHRFSITFDLGKSREELFYQADEERRQREAALVEATKEAQRQNLISESIQKGRAFLQSGDYYQAYAEFQQAVSADPLNSGANALLDSADSMIQLAIRQEQDVAIAQALDKEAAAQTAARINQFMERGTDFFNKNRFTDALIQFRYALELAPNNPTILNAIKTANDRMKGEVSKLVEKGRLEFREGNYSDALLTLNQALVLSPDDPELKDEINTLANRIKIQQYVQDAMNLYDQGRFEDALKLFDEALKMDPTNQQLLNYVERSRRGMGMGEQPMDPESERKYIQGVDLFLAGKYQEALTIWRELEVKYPYSRKLQDNIRSAEDRLKRTR